MNEVFATVTALAVFALLWHVQQSAHGPAHVPEGCGGEGCQFGSQPYYFEDSGGGAFNETPSEWHLRPFDPACEPRDLIAPLLNASRTGPSAKQLVIMIFGDSIDRIMMSRLCKLADAEQRGEPGSLSNRTLRYQQTTFCNTSQIVLVHSWTNGILHQPAHAVMSPQEALAASASVLLRLTGRRSPDIAFIGNCLWHIRGFVAATPALFPKVEKELPQSFLGGQRVENYVDNMRDFIRMLRDTFPGVGFVAVHTTAQYNPRTLLSYEAKGRNNNGKSALQLREGPSKQLVYNNWVATINAALRHLARQDNIPLVDVEPLMQQLPASHCYTGDGVHPHGDLLVTVVMNLVLNEYERATSSRLPGAARLGLHIQARSPGPVADMARPSIAA